MPRRQTRTLTIEKVQARFANWRGKRRGRTAIPDELWSAAGELARREGVNRIAAALHLDGGKLKRRMAAGATSARTVAPEFVELIVPRTTGKAEYTIELEGRQGTLRIHCKDTSAADLVRLSRALWSAVS
ncbi:MAG TPA: hypothetical protein VNY30_08515 [Bryobacteraceae bacterium]|nr:hypothetical protein [Bryobacteraceae bacterium]